MQPSHHCTPVCQLESALNDLPTSSGKHVPVQASGIPAFFVGFVLTPLASNASELLSSLKFAGRKQQRNASLTFAQVAGRCTSASQRYAAWQRACCENPRFAAASRQHMLLKAVPFLWHDTAGVWRGEFGDYHTDNPNH